MSAKWALTCLAIAGMGLLVLGASAAFGQEAVDAHPAEVGLNQVDQLRIANEEARIENARLRAELFEVQARLARLEEQLAIARANQTLSDIRSLYGLGADYRLHPTEPKFVLVRTEGTAAIPSQ
jgi:hypothetical protein